MSKLKLSFAVNTYNFEQYARDCLASILAQSDLPEFEIVVVDDASVDRTVEAIQSFNMPQIRLIQNEVNAGPAVSWERAIRECRGEYIARIDGDDQYDPKFASTLISVLDSHSEAGLAYAKVCVVDEFGKLIHAVAPWCRTGGDRCVDEYLTLFVDNRLPTCAMMARNEVWHQALPLEQNYVVLDWPMNLRMARNTKFYFCDAVLGSYRIHSTSTHKLLNPKKMEETVMGTLQEFFSDPSHHEQKLELEQEYRTKSWLGIADRYFGAGLFAEARRCYINAIGHSPHLLLKREVMKHLLATLTPHRLYSSLAKMRRGNWK